MIWQSPWSWLGAATLVLPILIHFLGRGPTRRVRFPSLRFIEGSRWLPSHRTRLQDPLLLALRLAILLVAVAALAQPLRRSPDRQQALDRALSRVVVLDTSMSMQRAAVAGGRVAERAAEEAARLVASADDGLLLRTATPARALQAAAAWLQGRAGQSEVVIVSDFQLGAIDSAALAVVPPTTGIVLAPIPAVPAAERVRLTQQDGQALTARIETDSASTTVTWAGRGGVVAPSPVTLLADARTIDAVRAGAGRIGLPAIATARHRVAILLPEHAERAALLPRARVPRAAWMLQLLATVRASPLLDGARAEATAAITTPSDSALITVRAGEASALVSAWADSVAGQERLVLDVHAADASVLTSALLAVVARALADVPPLDEWEEGGLSAEQLAAWQRAPATSAMMAAPGDAMTGPSDGRWLWLLALLLLGVEFLLRQRRIPPREGPDVVA